MNQKTITTAVFGVCSAIIFSTTTLNAQTVLYSDTLQSASDASNWAVNHSGADYQAVFGYDYSLLGIPQDPFLTGTTTALKFQVNQTAGVQQGVSASPLGLGLSGNYTMTFDMWLNYNTSGAGSTQIGTYGIGTAGNSAQWAGNSDSLLFGNITDVSSTYYRVYTNHVAGGATLFAAGSQNNTAAYYTSRFPSVTVPASETATNAGETGSTAAGTIGFQWVQVAITSSNNIVTESINGNLIATVNTGNLTLSTNIFLGLYDSNNGSANSTPDLNLALFSNLNVVSVVPEPTTGALAVLGAAGLFLIRRRRKSV